ncbi:aldehyde dehydrogenase family protein [Kutzneria sp. CA-103260]|uniref:aldehyde dehydrogenase family protein n=1 Tax=Kutzneria sp. CA-103260 TaxID=2802641 RepID=UPI001BA86325|nr:aldehyde dehydrogenase family protein [Kutzneria sp. CA-103260]QUQ65307.1 aldehyde dehydrogenase [Kutzneria sp. CA-103260]
MNKLDVPPGRIFRDGWTVSHGGVVDVPEPATGAVLTTVGVADPADIRAAAATARAAQREWAAAPATERAQVCYRAAGLLETHNAQVKEWLIREGGATASKAEYEIGAVLAELRVAASLPTRPHGHLLPAEPGQRSLARRVPLGVVGVISPWNVPMLLGLRAVAPALALGNAVVWKPDLRTPVSGGYLPARIFEEAGLPTGVLQVLAGGQDTGAALVADPDIAMIAFTGSSRVGRLIGEVAGRGLKRVSLELGGNSPLLVLDDADVDAASSAGAFGAFFHQGQICMAASRHIVLADVADEYVDRLVKRAQTLRVGDPWTDRVDLGPMIDDRQADRVESIIRDSVALGASVATGGGRRGRFHEPTVLTGVTPAMPAFTEEIFGPVAPVTVARTEQEAVALANQTEYGLAAAIQTGSVARGLALAEQLDAALIHINDQTVNDTAFAPFGGRKASGNGSSHGAEQNSEAFTQWQWLTMRDTSKPFPV